MKSGDDGTVVHMTTEGKAKCEEKGNFNKLIKVAAWKQGSANNHKTTFKIETCSVAVSDCGVFAHPESTLPGLKASVEILLFFGKSNQSKCFTYFCWWWRCSCQGQCFVFPG